jgi:hypothetical protein
MISHFYVTELPEIIQQHVENGWTVQGTCCGVFKQPGHGLTPLYSAFSPKLNATFYSQYVMDVDYCLYIEQPDSGFFPTGLVCYFPPPDPATSVVPLYMVFNLSTQDIAFTKDGVLVSELELEGYSLVDPYGLLHGNLLPNGSPLYPYFYVYPEAVAGTIPLYQLLVSQHHRYITDEDERSLLLKAGAADQGTIGWVYAPPPGLAPFYASISPSGAFFYTMDISEHLHALTALGHKGQGIVCYCYPTSQPQPPNTAPLYRMYSQTEDDHFYTTDLGEVNNYQAFYKEEGVAAYVYKPASNQGFALFQLFGPSSTNVATAAGIGPVPGTCGDE